MLYRDAEGALSKHVARNQLSVWRIHRDDFAHSVAFALVAYASYVVAVALRRLRYRICTKFHGRLKISEVDL